VPATGQPTESQLPGGPPSSPGRPAQGQVPTETVALETPATTPEPAKPLLIKAAPRPIPPHRASSLDELIAQIAESR